jgi:demethylmenaquinone methyltransferase/2-methoxy-6-polyprenyl-1,4-benzoquinol methylase
MNCRMTVPAESQHRADRVLLSKAETKAFYNKISKVYDLLAERAEEPVRRAGLRKLNAWPGEKVLEIGFGTGHSLIALAKAVGPAGSVYGIDLSDQMLKIAQGHLHEAGLADRVQLQCADAAELPYPAEMMDAVLMSFTLELFDAPEIPRVLAECWRVLRPGGRIMVVGMSQEGEGTATVEALQRVHQHFPNFLDCRPIFVRRALEAAGFHIGSVERQALWVPIEIVLALKVPPISRPRTTERAEAGSGVF